MKYQILKAEKINKIYGKRKVVDNVDIEVKIDEELLINIAEATGGMYFRANSMDKLEKIYEQIESLEKTELEELKFYNHEEKFEIFALISLILLFSEFILKYTLLKNIA